MNDSVTISGEIDGSFTSYWDSGETVGKEITQSKKPNTELLPDEVNHTTITDLQYVVVLTAVLNREKGTDAIGELIGKDGGYVRATLKRVCPEWYNEVFKPAGSEGISDNPFLNSLAQECDSCGGQIVIHDPMDGPPQAKCKCQSFPLRPLPGTWTR